MCSGKVLFDVKYLLLYMIVFLLFVSDTSIHFLLRRSAMNYVVCCNDGALDLHSSNSSTTCCRAVGVINSWRVWDGNKLPLVIENNEDNAGLITTHYNYIE